jgi:hypothetical protein
MLSIDAVLTQKEEAEGLSEAIAEFLLSRKNRIEALTRENATEELLTLQEQIQEEIARLKLELAKTRSSIGNINDVMQHYLS